MNAVDSATPLAEAERVDLAPWRDGIEDLVQRRDDAATKALQYENEARDLTMQLKRTSEAAEYHRKRQRGLEKRILANKIAMRALEDDMHSVYADE